MNLFSFKNEVLIRNYRKKRRGCAHSGSSDQTRNEVNNVETTRAREKPGVYEMVEVTVAE